MIVNELQDLDSVKTGDVIVTLPRRALTIRKPDEILGMEFDESDRLLDDRLWAVGQPLTILGAGGTGKSRLLLFLAACMITGREFLGMETRGRGRKWLILQTENSNQRLKKDLQSLKAWAGDDWPLIADRMVIHTIEADDDGFVCLDHPENQKAIEDLIREVSPDFIAFDPLNDFGMGDLSKDVDMVATTRTLSRICKKGNPNRAIVVLHHALTGKGGAVRATGFDRSSFGRNSKMLQAWTRGQINVSSGNPDNNEELIISCGKCSNGREFSTFAVKLDTETMIYTVDPDFDIEGWQSAVAGKKTTNKVNMTPQDVAELCGTSGKTKGELSKEIVEETGCGKSSAYSLINKAEKSKAVIRLSGSRKYVKK